MTGPIVFLASGLFVCAAILMFQALLGAFDEKPAPAPAPTPTPPQPPAPQPYLAAVSTGDLMAELQKRMKPGGAA